jgi:hypothetical protein
MRQVVLSQCHGHGEGERLKSGRKNGRLYVPAAAAAPVKVSLLAAYNPNGEPTSSSAMKTIDNLFKLPSLPL